VYVTLATRPDNLSSVLVYLISSDKIEKSKCFTFYPSGNVDVVRGKCMFENMPEVRYAKTQSNNEHLPRLVELL
jgi:hypothetical protein